jgi:hypothetical protein
MTFANKQYSKRFAGMLAVYGDYNSYTNLIFLLADALHWCYCNNHNLASALETALIHFGAEISQERRP